MKKTKAKTARIVETTDELAYNQLNICDRITIPNGDELQNYIVTSVCIDQNPFRRRLYLEIDDNV